MDLTVKIKKKFRRDLFFRFNPANAVVKDRTYYSIDRACPLCKIYKKCEDCPFKAFTKGEKGCIMWIKKIIGKNYLFLGYSTLDWGLNYDIQVRQQLKELRAKARKLITFY